MATANPFDLLVDNENDDLSQLIAAQKKKVAVDKPAAPPVAKLPSKPLPPAQAVRESRNSPADVRDGGIRRGAPGRGLGGRGVGVGQNKDFGNGNNIRYGGGAGGGAPGGGAGGGGSGSGSGGYRGGTAPEEGDTGKTSEVERGSYGQPRGPFRGGRRGGFVEGNTEGGLDSERPQRRVYERRSGTGRGFEMKREGAGRGNWGTMTEDVNAQETEENVKVEEKPAAPEKQVDQEDGQRVDSSKDKDGAANETEMKEPEDNEMTLEEYEKVREEKRKALLAMKVEERKVEPDRDLQSMQQLSVKKGNDDVFIKLGSDKDSTKKKDNAEKEDKAKKVVSINEFLKPAEGERYYSASGRGRGRGRGGDRGFGSFRGGYTGASSISPAAPSIADQGQFPTLGAK